ncbi:ABC transporter family substrate-binding protein [Microbacterium sp. NPDC089987]|uniref:ABC transporter family substrate-binding protein n=1 Tax=Microbacterium sp. NPDC089987 TaxID=3364202 RepID=UPI003818EF26
MKQHKLMGALALTGAFALALSGCAADSGNSGDGSGNGGDKATTNFADYNPQPRENLKEGGVANFPINEVPEQLNQFNGDGSADTARIAAWYMPQLILFKDDGTPYKNDAYLDEWKTEVKDGNTVITFTFNKDAHWNDGTDMDWTAIDATWKANRSDEDGFVPNATSGYKEVKSVEMGDTAKTAVVTYDGEYPWIAKGFTILLHPAINTPDLFNTAFIDNPHAEWGAGPFTIDSFDANTDFVSFKPNPEWWGDKPLLEKVTFQGMDAQASINAFKNGQIDQVGVNSKDRLAQVSDMKDITIHRATQTANTLLEVDAEKPQFADVEVREAFFKAVNIEQQKQIAWNGLDYEEADAGSFVMYPFQPGYSNSLEKAGWKHDPKAANKLLDDAGWEKGSDGIREKDGVKLSVTYPIFSDDPTQAALAQSLQKSEKEIGIDVKIDVRPSNKFAEDYNGKNWDIASLRFTSSDPYGVGDFFQIYGADQGLNLSGVWSDETDEKIHEVEKIKDGDDQIAAAMKLEPELLKGWGLIPLYNGPTISAVKTGLANLTPEPYVGLDGFGIQPVENVGWEK